MAIPRLPIQTLMLLLAVFVIVPICAATQDPGWPREVVHDDATVVYYQPQIDDWKDFKELTGRLAISITPRGGKPQVGVVTVQMHTEVDVDSRNALLSNPQVISTTFPDVDQATSQQLDQLVRKSLNPQATLTISVDRLVASVAKKNAAPVAEVKNDPPTIFASYGPAILLFVDGEPTLAPIQNSNLSFVVNANWPLFTDNTTHQYYLFTGQSWVTSTDLKSGWAEIKTLPAEMSKLPGDPAWADLKPYIPVPKGQKTTVPGVYFSNVPAELITFDGPPVYSTISGTGLVLAKNTGSDVFVFSSTQTFYYLTGGRWFSAPALTGPWTFATNELPPDFAKIPRDNPAARVLSSVPGTPEAEDAVLLAQIPTTVEINPTEAASAVKVAYTGEPEFQPIQGTELSYATNTPDKVIKVNDRYYVCTKGVWFDAASPSGPWQTTTSVPQAIYTIPPSSPVYNVTYVTQEVTPSGSVQASYTAGYVGVFIMGAVVGAIIANGNGYYYPPYIGYGPGRYPVYYPRPMPYGYHTYNPYTGASGVRGGVYGPNGSAQWGASYNPNTGTYARGATASGRYGSASAGQAYNPYTGAYGATRQGSNAYGQWGSSVVTKGNQWAATQHQTTAKGTVATYQNSAGGKAIASNTVNGRAAAGKTASGDVYAGRDGNVYKNTNSGWQKYDNGGWNSVNKPAPRSTQPNAQSAQTPRPTTTQTVNSAAARQPAKSPQQQRPVTSPATRPAPGNSPSPAGGYNRPSAQTSVNDLNRDRQNRQRGSAQSQRFSQAERGGGARR